MNYQSTSPLFIFTKFYLNHLRCPPEKILLLRNKIVRLAQSVEHETLNLGVVGSSPTLGASCRRWNVGQIHSA